MWYLVILVALGQTHGADPMPIPRPYPSAQECEAVKAEVEKYGPNGYKVTALCIRAPSNS